MEEYSCTIRLQHAYAQRFFDEVVHPNLDDLQRRDDFLTELEATCPIRTEGTDIVVEIPDIDIVALMAVSEHNSYITVGPNMYHYNCSQLKASTQKQDCVYFNNPMRNIAA